MIPNDKKQKAIEMNNAIVHMRQPIRKARLFILSKLTREAKKYRNRHADEKQLAKFKNKADRFVREIIAAKKVKDDEITRYGILNLETLESTSQDPTVSDRTRIIAKIGNYKTIRPMLKDFTVKFKDYISMISLEKKKKKSKSKKSKSEQGKELQVTKKVSSGKSDVNSKKNHQDNNKKDSKECEDVNNDGEDNDSDSHMSSEDKIEEDQQDIPQPSEPKAIPDTVATKPEKKAGIKKKEVKKEKELVEKESPSKDKLKKPVRVISKEASVKRFTEVLQEEDTENYVKDPQVAESPTETIQIEKTVDDFFMSADGRCGHLVAVPAQTMDTDNTNWEEDRTGRHFQKNSQRNQSGRTFVNDKKWGKDSKRPGKWNDTDKPHSNPKKRKEYSDFSRKNDFAEGKKRGRSKELPYATTAEHLHPSWEAKKKQQEIMKQGFQGKKIVFDD